MSTCTCTCIYVNIRIGIHSIGKDSDGHPTLKTTGCSLSVGSLSVKFHGGASWLYNLFSGSIADSVKSSMQGQVGQRSKVKGHSSNNLSSKFVVFVYLFVDM